MESPKRTVLIVDDDLRISAMLKAFLSQCGYHVLLANDGVAGIHGTLNRRPDLVLIDVKMPGMDGIAAVTAIKNMNLLDPQKRRPRVVLMSGSPEKETISKAKELKVDAFLVKPFSLHHLRERIDVVLARLDFAELQDLLALLRHPSKPPDADKFRRYDASWLSFYLHYKGTNYQLMISKAVDVRQASKLNEAEALKQVAVFSEGSGGWSQAWPSL